MSHISTNTISIPKFCKVCQDAGKSETEYKSHFTRESRDTNSRVICPTLLALNCRYCFKKGHTVKYCQVLKNNDKDKKPYNNQSITKNKPKTESKLIISNIFVHLDSEGEEEEKKELIIKEDFPKFVSASSSFKCIKPVLTNYADALLKQKVNTIMPSIIKPAPWISEPNKTLKMKSWADDWSDSDDDNDEE